MPYYEAAKMTNTEKIPTTNPSKAITLAEALAVTPPTTPSTLSSSVHQLVSEIRDIHTKLSELLSLAPSEQVNALLTRLVNLCVVPYSTEFTMCFFKISGVEQLCDKLRPICSAAEGELEKYWAERMLDSSEQHSSSTNILQSFPYYNNYVDLSRLEASLINAFLPSPPTSIAFLGSGPLPLTSLCFLSHYPSARIYNIDRDATALRLSTALCHKLGLGERMSFTNEDVTHVDPTSEDSWTKSQVVFLAALVGTDTKSKLDILCDLTARLQPGCLVVARSAQGMRSVLYPILQLSENLQAVGLEILAELHPWTTVVNSVIVLRVKGR